MPDDFISQGLDWLMNGKTAGLPNIMIIAGIAMVFLLIYMFMTRKPRVKEFKPLDMKKETKRRFKRDYKYNGKSLNKYIFNSTDSIKPIAYGIGYMKEMENKTMKRYEPILEKIPKEKWKAKQEELSQEIYQKTYLQLTKDEKKTMHGIVEEALRNEKIEEMPANQLVRYVKGKKETVFFEQVPLYVIKVCQPDLMSRLLARGFGYGIDWFVLEEWQVDKGEDRITLTADYQRRQPFDIFVHSPAGKNFVQDITYGQERENIWQETANQIPRAVHFDTEASKQLLYRREDAKLEKDKRRAQTESHEMT